MRLRVVLCLALIMPLAGGCKMFLAKTAVRLAVGPEQAEKLDPLAQIRRKVISELKGEGASTPALLEPRPVP